MKKLIVLFTLVTMYGCAHLSHRIMHKQLIPPRA